MSDQPNASARPLISFITGDNVPQFSPAAINRPWMSEMRRGWANRCLPMLIANQSGWELRNPSAFTATWMGGNDITKVTIAPGGSATGGFRGALSGSYSPPSNCVVNGQYPCR